MRIERRVLAFTAPYRLHIGLALVASIVEAGLSGAFTKLMRPLVDTTFLNDGEGSTRYYLPLLIVGIFLARGLFGYVVDIFMAKAGRGVSRDMRIRLFDKYLRMSASRLDRDSVQAKLIRLGSDSDHASQAAVDVLKVLVQQSLQIVAMLVVMLWTSWQLTVAALLLSPPLAWAVTKIGRRHRLISHQTQEGSANLLQLADQTLSNQQDIKVYGAQGIELERYATQASAVLKLNLKGESTRSLSSATVQLIGAGCLALLLYFAGREAARGHLTAGDFVALMASMMAILPALKQLASVQGMWQRGIVSAERVFDVLDSPYEPDTGTRRITRSEGLIEFRNVTARYPGEGQPTLLDVSFVARPGTVTAIVGRSGSGKSTLAKLIPRFYDVEEGQILLDGHRLDTYRLEDLRRQIAMVSQQVPIFDGSIAENVAYGDMHEADPESLARAVSSANADEFIERLPGKLACHVGPKGGRLSGGQRQRIAIARALLKNAPILILDEATAALDPESERLVQDALDRLTPNRTTLVIAHKLATIERADQILVLDRGRIVECGTHGQLLGRQGLYAHLHRMYSRKASMTSAIHGDLPADSPSPRRLTEQH